MAQNYASKYQKQIDEVFRLESVTSSIINNGIRLDFSGVNTVTIYTVDTVAENNYVRSGKDRFGTLVELGTGRQSFVLSQDKSFTFSIDRGNLEDSMMAQEAGAALQREIEVVCVPNTDIYRLATLQAYGVANSQSTTVALTTSNAFAQVVADGVKLTNRRVPKKNRVMFATATTIGLLKQDTTNFVKPSDLAQDQIAFKGLVGKVDGNAIIEVPDDYLPANTAYIIVSNDVLVAPSKFDMYRTLKEVPGVDGWVVEGRRYFDAFIPTNRGKALQVHMNG